MLYHPADLTGPETKPTDPSSPSHQDSEETDDTHIQTTKLVISHVDVRVTPEELSTLFSTKGRISSLALMEDKYVCLLTLLLMHYTVISDHNSQRLLCIGVGNKLIQKCKSLKK